MSGLLVGVRWRGQTSVLQLLLLLKLRLTLVLVHMCVRNAECGAAFWADRGPERAPEGVRDFCGRNVHVRHMAGTDVRWR